MTFPHAGYDVYSHLRDLDTTHPEVEGDGWRLGHTASWARWGSTTDDLAPISASNPEQFADLTPLTTSIVLFGLTWAEPTLPENPTHWQNFHRAGHRPDDLLAESIGSGYRTVLGPHSPVAYMTDVFKLLPAPDAAALETMLDRELAHGRDHVARCAELLKVEMDICRSGAWRRKPVLVAMGDAAFDWLTGARDPRIADALDASLGYGAHRTVTKLPQDAFPSSSAAAEPGAMASILRYALVYA